MRLEGIGNDGRKKVGTPPDVLDVYGLFQTNGMPAGTLVQAELQRVCRTLCLVRCQYQEAAVVAILIDALQRSAGQCN